MTEINPQILEIVPQKKLEDLATAYKLKIFANKDGRKPNIKLICTQSGVGSHKYRKMVALLGGAEQLHEFLGRDLMLQHDNLTALLEETIEAQRADIPNMTPKERNELISILSKMVNPQEVQTQVQVNNTFNMDEYLSGRL